ncbi:ribonuclease [Sphingomonas sp. CGMCC 1.13654]|uniref:Ribonuclease n=1 Tax=Sphingomonas chungangi TaxID=2683589 RepID=A0A838LCX4_9SPHN|nr:ribonuclease [Sphingomonas chungangi]MBA2935348.1 ribonuclease [Sphingomonas chungangi]MVW56855.1 ribonuclease [Sphingomonas chungangi]
MAEWILDQGIGEHRAALIDGDDILEAAIDRLDDRLRVGAVVTAKLGERIGSGAWLSTARGDAVIEAVPRGLSQGRSLLVEIVREAIPEPGRLKPPRARVSDATEERPAPTLVERFPDAHILSPHEPDRLEQAGWSELIEQAETGEIDFAGGALRLSPTPAMALFDVDGALPPAELAILGARAAARSVRRLAIGGSIGVDLPTLGSKAERAAAAQAIDDVLLQPFERTAVNGFGFVQIVRPRPRASIPELVRADPALAAALALLRRAARGHGPRTLVAAPPVIDRMGTGWLEQLARRTGGTIGLRADPALAISAAHVEP